MLRLLRLCAAAPTSVGGAIVTVATTATVLLLRWARRLGHRMLEMGRVGAAVARRLTAEVRPVAGGAQVSVAVGVSLVLLFTVAGGSTVAHADDRPASRAEADDRRASRAVPLERQAGQANRPTVAVVDLIERLIAAHRARPADGPVADRLAPYRISPGYEMRWPHDGPLTGWWGEQRGARNHLGIDVNGEVGDPIVAAAPGRVLLTGYVPGYGGYGIVVVLDHGPVRTLYAHLDAVHVQPGQLVPVGHHIANMGVTGRVTGSHLHFEVREGDTPVDPGPWLARRP